ncbi:MAG TPA: TolC family protein [Myxococcota bacterium]|jgi:cobalt-zinc-cadmium efflux system outer membrane protein
MTCTASLRCAVLIAAGLSLPLASRAQAPAPYPVGRELSTFEAPASAGASLPDVPPEPTGVLRLEQALAAALLRNPELAADAYEVRAREAALLQAGAFPNPTLSLEVEDFAGSGPFSGVESAQTTLLLGQLIELGGKRAARVDLAAADRDLAAWDHEVRRIDVLVRTADEFVDLLAAQERLRLADEALELARSMQRAASLRLRAGIGSPAEGIRAEVQVDVASVDREHTEHELATARQALAAMWSGEEPHFERAAGDLEQLPIAPSAEEVAQLLEASPSVARWRTQLARRDALRARATSDRIPDVTLIAGPRRLSGPDDTALVVGVAIPLPLWNRSRGAIAEAEHRVAKTVAEARASRVRAVMDLAEARIGLQASTEEAHLLRTRVLPGSERAVEALRRGYEQGRFAQVEVLDAERARLGAREQYLGALVEAHHNAQQIERLTGVPLEVRP